MLPVCVCVCVYVHVVSGVFHQCVKHQVNLSLGLNTSTLFLSPESFPMCGGVHALPQCPLQLPDPLRRLPHGILGSWKRKLGSNRSSEEEDEEEGWKQSSKSRGESVFLLSVYFVLKTHPVFLHWNHAVLTNNNLTKGVSVGPFA